jgi:hypothetical protein
MVYSGGVQYCTMSSMVMQCFLLSILWCSQTGNDPHEDLAKFCLEAKYENHFLDFGYLPWIMYRNLIMFL